jgi:hypothetical protein
MKLVINCIKYGFPILLLTDYGSIILDNPSILNLSRILRSFMLVLFLIENIRFYHIIKHFYFFRYLSFFAFVLLIYVFTDRNLQEGFWMYLRFLYWVLGINVLYAYAYTELFVFNDYFKVIKRVVLIAFLITIYYFSSGFIADDYNVAAYLVVSLYPIVLFASKSFSKEKIFILVCMISVFITIKRGAVIAFSLSTILYFLGDLIEQFSIKKMMLGITMLSVFALTVFYAVSEQEDRLDDRLSADQFDLNNSKAGSGRVGMYTSIYNSWYDTEYFIFGHGNQEDSYRNLGRRTHAHSDIFGFMYNFGLVGLLLILFLYVKVIMFFIEIKSNHQYNRYSVLAFLCVLFLVNLYSGLFYITETIYLFSFLPYLQIEVMNLEDE